MFIVHISKKCTKNKCLKCKGDHNILLHTNINSDESNKNEKKVNKAKSLIRKDYDIKINKIESLIPDKENITALVNLKTSSG